MAIRRFSIAEPGVKSNRFWDQDTAQGAMEHIQTVSITSSGGFSFSNIPQNYKDLMLVCNVRHTAAQTTGYSIMFFNGNASSGYSRIYFYGTGSAVTSARDTNYSQWYGIISPGASATSGIFSSAVIHLLNYSNTNTFKTIIERNSTDLNGSGFSMLSGGLYRDTAAITSIGGGAVSGTYAAGTTFTLYGIKASA